MENTETTLGNLKRLFKIFPQRWLVMIGVLMVFLLSSINLFYSFLLKRLLDAALAADMDGFIVAIALTGIAVTLEVILKFLNVKTIGKYGEQGVALLRNMLTEKLNQASYESLKINHSGDYISRATNDLIRIRSFSTNNIILLIYNPLMAIGALFLLFVLNWKLTSIILAVLPVMMLGASLISKPMGKYSKQLQKKLGIVNSVGQDIFTGIEVVKAFNLEKTVGERYDDTVDKAVYQKKKLAKRNAVLRSFSQFFSVIPLAISVGYGGYWVIDGSMTAGSLLAFVHLLNHLTYPLTMIPQLIGLTKSDMAAAGRVFEVLNMETEREDGEVFSLNTDNVIEFSNVNFAYGDGAEKIINDLSFHIKRGETVALVGPSGGGKSTILKLILGLYENYEGQVTLFDNSIKKWNLNSMRQQISLVSQDTYLFPEKIKENILYGKMSATEEEVLFASNAANAHTFIKSLSNGYDTEVGELGNNLSGGEQQRISIARAILKDAPILFLDEATSALDQESESLIQESLSRFMEGRTSLVIAHRLSTIRNADRILVIDQGSLVESGTHGELIELGGLYSKLYLRQLATSERSENRNEVAGK